MWGGRRSWKSWDAGRVRAEVFSSTQLQHPSTEGLVPHFADSSNKGFGQHDVGLWVSYEVMPS